VNEKQNLSLLLNEDGRIWTVTRLPDQRGWHDVRKDFPVERLSRKDSQRRLHTQRSLDRR